MGIIEWPLFVLAEYFAVSGMSTYGYVENGRVWGSNAIRIIALAECGRRPAKYDWLRNSRDL